MEVSHYFRISNDNFFPLDVDTSLPITFVAYHLQRGNKLFTTDQLKSWELSFDIKPVGTVDGWNNILQCTASDEYTFPKYGSRMPAIWFHSKSTRLHIYNSINGTLVYHDEDKDLPMNVFTNIQMRQTLSIDGVYIFTVAVNGKSIWEVINGDAKDWSDVKVYLSSPWYPPANAYIQNFKFKNIPQGQLIIL